MLYNQKYTRHLESFEQNPSKKWSIFDAIFFLYSLVGLSICDLQSE